MYMRLPIQVAAIIYYGNSVLLLRRKPEKGGFWQYVSGGLEEGETLERGIKREIREETGIEDIKNIERFHMFQFREFDTYKTDSSIWYTEFVFAVESGTRKTVLGEEHDDYRWVGFEKAMELLKYEDNKIALNKLHNQFS